MKGKLLLILFITLLTVMPVTSNIVYELHASNGHYDYTFKNVKQFWHWMDANGYTQKNIAKWRVLPTGESEVHLEVEDDTFLLRIY